MDLKVKAAAEEKAELMEKDQGGNTEWKGELVGKRRAQYKS